MDTPNPSRPAEFDRTEPDQPDTPAGTAMPASAADPAAATGPVGGDVPPMSTPRVMQRFDAWNYREDADIGDGSAVVGFKVEAVDGHVGKIDEASTMVGDSYLVVDTGPWIFGKKVLLPAGTVNNVDRVDVRVYVDRTRHQIKDAPEFDPDDFHSPEYLDKVATYYAGSYQDPDRRA